METNSTTREKKHINIEDVAPFESVGDLKIITTDELCKPINTMFKSVFKDYYGCKLQVQYQPDRGSFFVVPSLVFQVLPNDQYDNENNTVAFKPITARGDVVSRVECISRKSIGNTVEMTLDGKDIFSDFIITGRNQNIDWQNCYRSIKLDSGTYIELFKLDIVKILKTIFGDKDEFGSEYFYQVTPTYKLNNQYKAVDNWALNILRLNHDNEIAVANMLGMYVAPKSGINVITATVD